MARDRRAALAAALVLALLVVLEFLPALSLSFAGDDFELISLARIGGFSPRALALPHRGAFVKPVLNAAWAGLTALFGASAGLWYTVALLVHLLDAALLGLLAWRLAEAWSGSGAADARDASRGPGANRDDPHPADRRPWSPSALTGLLTAFVWAVHDRLSEPVFSIASLNHSLTFGLYLAALLAAARALSARSPRVRLVTALFLLLTLFSYEVGASVLLALGLLVVFSPDVVGGVGGVGAGGARGRLKALGLPAAGAVLVWGLIQGLSRLAPGAVSYYTLSPSLWLRNLAEIGLAFVHIPSYRIEPHPLWALPVAAGLLAGALVPRVDRLVRFGCAWALAASLPVLPIPFFSDRYHYIVFAGIALAVGRGAVLILGRAASVGARPAAARRVPRTVAAVVILAGLTHVAWSIAGAREQAAYYAFKNFVPANMLEEARAAEEAVVPDHSQVLAIVWRGAPDGYVRFLQEGEMHLLNPRFSETHSIYVRPQGILGAVYPVDLFNVAAADSGRFYRRPPPARAARGIAEGHVRVVAVGLFRWDRVDRGDPAGLPTDVLARLAARLRDALLTRREIPLSLPDEEGIPARDWNVAWLEPTDRTGALEAEYGPSAAPAQPAAATP